MSKDITVRDGVQGKVCSRVDCKLWKPLVDFNKCSSRPDGYQTSCRYCEHYWRGPEGRARIAMNRVEKADHAAQGMRKCSQCHKIKVLTTSFPDEPRSPHGKSWRCYECAAEASLEYYYSSISVIQRRSSAPPAWTRPCKIDICTDLVGDKGGHGWCQEHYSNWYRHGDPLWTPPPFTIPTNRRCNGPCGKILPIEEFVVASRTRSGYGYECKECHRIRTKKYSTINRDIINARSRQKYAENPDIVLSRTKKWQATNPDKKRSAQQRRRSALRKLITEKFTDLEIFERDNWICQLCGDPIDPLLQFPDNGSVTLDHIWPQSLGGPHLRVNTQSAHNLCNMRKNAKMPAHIRLW